MMTPSNKWYAIAGRTMRTARPDLWRTWEDAEKALRDWVTQIAKHDYKNYGTGGFEVTTDLHDDGVRNWRFIRLMVDDDVYGIDDHEVFDWNDWTSTSST